MSHLKYKWNVVQRPKSLLPVSLRRIFIFDSWRSDGSQVNLLDNFASLDLKGVAIHDVHNLPVKISVLGVHCEFCGHVVFQILFLVSLATFSTARYFSGPPVT